MDISITNETDMSVNSAPPESEKKVYSFSRLSAWDSCKLSFRYKYLDGIKGEDNWFSRFGTFAHLIFEMIDRGKMPPRKAWDVWTRHYQKRVLNNGAHEFPWMAKWYDDASNFFFTFKGFRTSAKYIEQYIEIDRGNYILRGYIDRGSDDIGGSVLCDYKSSNPFSTEDVLKKRRQLYLYSAYEKEKAGSFPKELIFLFFRKNEYLRIPFNEDDYNEAWAWADRTVLEIEEKTACAETEYPPTVSDFFCKTICDYRNTCPFSPNAKYRTR